MSEYIFLHESLPTINYRMEKHEFNAGLLNHLSESQDVWRKNLFVGIFFLEEEIQAPSCQADLPGEKRGPQGFFLLSLHEAGFFLSNAYSAF